MATCSVCGKEYGLFGGALGRCDSCIKQASESAKKVDFRTTPEMAERQELAAKILLTTETAAADLRIAERLGIVTAECVFGMHMFKDLFAAGRDIFGGRSEAVQNTLKDARKTALEEIQLEAASLGADAVVGLNLNYSEISGGGKSMLFLVATGTAVKIRQQGPA